MAPSTHFERIVERGFGIEGRGKNMVILEIVMTSVAILLVINRVFSRLWFHKGLGLDTYAILTSLAFCIAMNVVNIVSVDHGYGRPSSTVPADELVLAMKLFWHLQILYKFTINLTKMSILLLYRRLFVTTRFRFLCNVVFCYVTLYAVASIVATIVECRPIRSIYDKSIKGSCINLTAFWYANAVSNILSDLIILIMPLPVIRSLRLPPRQRYGLMAIFTLGIFVCATSVIRMQTLDVSSKSPDQSKGTMVSTLWTTVEANTAIICACLPMVRSTLTFFFPNMFPAFQYGGQAPPPPRTTFDETVYRHSVQGGTPETGDSSKISTVEISPVKPEHTNMI